MASGPVIRLKEAQAMLTDELAGLEQVSYKQHLALSPKHIGSVNKGISQHLQAKLRIYSDVLGGVPLAYSRVQRLQDGGLVVDDQPQLHLSVQVDVIVFKPQPASRLRATVNKLGRDYIGCLVHGCFNGSIAKPKNDPNHEWAGHNLSLGEEFVLEVIKVFSQNGILSMRGKLANDGVHAVPSASSMPSLGDFNTPASSAKKKKKKKSKSEPDKDGPADSTESASLLSDSGIPGLPFLLPEKKKNRKRKLSQCSSSVDSGINVHASPDIVDNNTQPSSSSKKHKKHKRQKLDHSVGSELNIKTEMVDGSHHSDNVGENDSQASASSAAAQDTWVFKTPKTEKNADIDGHGKGNSSSHKKHKKHKRIKQEPDT